MMTSPMTTSRPGALTIAVGTLCTAVFAIYHPGALGEERWAAAFSASQALSLEEAIAEAPEEPRHD
jgi:hypothetical protein